MRIPSSGDVAMTITSGLCCSLSNVLSALSQESGFVSSTSSREEENGIMSSAGHGKLTQVTVATN